MGDDILKDSRFTKYLNDPRYRQIPRHERKVKIDKRFQSMFKDDKFKVKYTVDKRGRPINETSTENLRRYYDLESDDSSDNEEEEPATSKETRASGQFVRRPTSESEDGEGGKEDRDSEQECSENDEQSEGEDEDSEKVDVKLKNDQLVRGKLEKKIKKKLHDLEIDYARGEGMLRTDSSSDEESSEAEQSSEEEHAWGELDADAETTEDATKRLAVCNMDWDNMKASDIMVLFNSFLPTGGVIHKVTIYPSEFGLKRMQEEELRGPIELTENKKKKENSDLSDDGGNEEGSSYNMEKLRRYELNRLKYYYAVVECDAVTTADKLYTDCDGMEYESSATKLDLRFIPDDVSFEQEPKEVCTKLPDLTKYKPRLFTTTALQQAKVDLTWDTTNPNRAEVIRNALDGQIDDLEIKEYLASSSEGDEEEAIQKASNSASDSEGEDPIMKYKNLLLDIQQKEDSKKNKDMEMEITWGLGVKEKAEQLVKKSQAEDKILTPFEKIMEKRREKQKQKKLERRQKIEKLKEQSDQEENTSSDDIPSDVDMNDPYFAEEFNRPEFKKEKKNKALEESADEEEEKRKAELELLLDEVDGKEHFSLKKIQAAENESKKSKRKRKLKEKMKEKEQAIPDFDINVDDARFSAIFNSHHFSIDPTDPNFKKTKNMEKLIQEKLKRRPVETNEELVPAKKTREEAELSLLVKSIKRKTAEAMKKTE